MFIPGGAGGGGHHGMMSHGGGGHIGGGIGHPGLTAIGTVQNPLLGGMDSGSGGMGHMQDIHAG